VGFGGYQVVYDVAVWRGVDVHNFNLGSEEVNKERYNTVGKGKDVSRVEVVVVTDICNTSRFVWAGEVHGETFAGWWEGIVRRDL
jgi:hypothetical protein